MKKVPRARQEMKTYTPDEIRLGLRAADKDRNGHLWYLALSGLRRGEIAGLRWEDVDFDASTISIARSRVQVGAATVAENETEDTVVAPHIAARRGSDQRAQARLSALCPGEAGARRGARGAALV